MLNHILGKFAENEFDMTFFFCWVMRSQLMYINQFGAGYYAFLFINLCYTVLFMNPDLQVLTSLLKMSASKGEGKI